MFSLLSASRLFIGCFIAFIGVFCIVFYEEHSHAWLLYALMLVASASAVWFFRYIGDVEKPEVRSQYIWNVRRLHYALFMAVFMGFLFMVFLVASIVQHSGISFEEELSSLGSHTLIAAIILLVLTGISTLLAWRMSDMHLSVLEQHDCITARQRAESGYLQVSDGLWAVPSTTSPHPAEDITRIVVHLVEGK